MADSTIDRRNDTGSQAVVLHASNNSSPGVLAQSRSPEVQMLWKINAEQRRRIDAFEACHSAKNDTILFLMKDAAGLDTSENIIKSYKELYHLACIAAIMTKNCIIADPENVVPTLRLEIKQAEMQRDATIAELGERESDIATRDNCIEYLEKMLGLMNLRNDALERSIKNIQTFHNSGSVGTININNNITPS
ncbi:hypothetical protein NX059_010140 [Plenodomus lindquistii]|nr:hypothetical protein NX059_010140 [Plenodomus lindquistii]